MKKWLSLLLVLVMVFSCSIVAQAEGEKKFPEDYRIGICVMGRPDEWSIQCYDSFVNATKDFKEAIILDGNLDHETQVKQFETLITQQVDMIIIDAYNPDGFVDLCERAKEAGILVGAYNTKLNWDGLAFYVTWSHSETGDLAGKWAVDYINNKLGGKATVATMRQDDYPMCILRVDAFLAQVEQLPGVEIVNQTNVAHTREAGQNTVLNYPEPVDVIYCVTDNGAQGAVAGLRQMQNDHTVVISSGGYGEEVNSLLRANDPNYGACVMVDPVILATETMEEAEKALTGNGENIVGREMEIYIADATNINEWQPQ